jgi:hypothetical protein
MSPPARSATAQWASASGIALLPALYTLVGSPAAEIEFNSLYKKPGIVSALVLTEKPWIIELPNTTTLRPFSSLITASIFRAKGRNPQTAPNQNDERTACAGQCTPANTRLLTNSTQFFCR